MQKVKGSNHLSSTAFFDNSFERIVTNIVTIAGRVFWFYASSHLSLKSLSMTVASPASEPADSVWLWHVNTTRCKNM